MSQYLQVLVESAVASSIIPLLSDTTFFAMMAFGGFNMMLAAVAAIIGATLGQTFNWTIGFILLKTDIKAHSPSLSTNYDKWKRLFHKYGVFLLLLCWIPMGNFLPLIAGFLGARLRLVLPLVFVAEAGYYVFQLM